MRKRLVDGLCVCHCLDANSGLSCSHPQFIGPAIDNVELGSWSSASRAATFTDYVLAWRGKVLNLFGHYSPTLHHWAAEAPRQIDYIIADVPGQTQ
eukprot:130441-Amphidinium_carterae.1